MIVFLLITIVLIMLIGGEGTILLFWWLIKVAFFLFLSFIALMLVISVLQ